MLSEFFESPLKTDFNCPVLNQKGGIRFVGGGGLLSCLNFLPPLDFVFPGVVDRGSVFAAGAALDHLKFKGVDIIVWLKGPVECVLKDPRFKDKELSYWLELVYRLNSLPTGPEVVVFDVARFSPVVCEDLNLGEGRLELDSRFQTQIKKTFNRLEKKLSSLKEKSLNLL